MVLTVTKEAMASYDDLGKVAKWNQMGAVSGIVVIMVVSEAQHFD